MTFSTTQLNNNKITLLSKIVTNKISSVYNFEKLFFAIFLSPGPSVAGIEPLTPGVNFTNILWATFAPKSFCQKITNPNCKYLKAVQRTLVWLSISPIFYKQLFRTKVLCAPFMCLQFGFVIFWRKEFGTKAAHIMLVKLIPGWRGKSSTISHHRLTKQKGFHMVCTINLLAKTACLFKMKYIF